MRQPQLPFLDLLMVVSTTISCVMFPCLCLFTGVLVITRITMVEMALKQFFSG